MCLGVHQPRVSFTFSFSCAEERMYAEMWEKDRQAKCRREEMEAAQQLERNRETLKVR